VNNAPGVANCSADDGAKNASVSGMSELSAAETLSGTIAEEKDSAPNVRISGKDDCGAASRAAQSVFGVMATIT